MRVDLDHTGRAHHTGQQRVACRLEGAPEVIADAAGTVRAWSMRSAFAGSVGPRDLIVRHATALNRCASKRHVYGDKVDRPAAEL
jgi:hypothetical protein